MTRSDGGVIQGLDEAALAVLFDVGVREHVERGTAVVREGDPGGEVWVLLSGACDVDVRGDRIATLGPGQLFGEIAALTWGDLDFKHGEIIISKSVWRGHRLTDLAWHLREQPACQISVRLGLSYRSWKSPWVLLLMYILEDGAKYEKRA